MAKSGASSKIETGNTSEVWTEGALLAHRVSTASTRRCCVEEDEDDYEEWALAQDLKIPQKPGPEVTKKDIVLPKGVDSLEKRGRVLITMDAWKKEKITFEKAISMAEHNDKMKKYLNFILAKFGEQACEELPTQAVDLAMYLQARNYQPKKGYERTFVS